MKILAIGPYIGDFKEEILQFRPYCRWLTEAVKWDKIYLSTHANRLFLYDFVPEENIIPVYQQFSRDEENQQGYLHKKVSQKDFKLIIKSFKEKILEKENCNKKDIEMHNISYTKMSTPYSYYKKIFEAIPTVNIDTVEKNKIVFIPAKEEKIEKLAYIKNYLKNIYEDELIIIGNTDTWFSDENVVLNKIDYFENGLKYCIKTIINAKCVICPSSYWTLICNLHRKNVFSWGPDISLYKDGGIYNRGNKNCFTIPSDNDTNPDIIIKSIRFFMKNIIS